MAETCIARASLADSRAAATTPRYQRRRPETTALYQFLQRHLATFLSGPGRNLPHHVRREHHPSGLFFEGAPDVPIGASSHAERPPWRPEPHTLRSWADPGIIPSTMSISVNLTEAQQKQLAEIAARLKLSVEQLAEAAIRDLLNGHADDFDAAAKRVLEKNEELYRRLG